MARNYWTDGTSALKPDQDDNNNNIVPFLSSDVKDDYSSYDDNSEAKDYSNYGDKVAPFPKDRNNERGEQKRNTRNSLADAEQSTLSLLHFGSNVNAIKKVDSPIKPYPSKS